MTAGANGPNAKLHNGQRWDVATLLLTRRRRMTKADLVERAADAVGPRVTKGTAGWWPTPSSTL